MIKKPLSFAAFSSRNFSLYWVGFFTSQLAVQISIVAITWHLYSLTKSPFSLGLLGLASFIPILLFSLPGGIVADKLERKTVLLVSQSLKTLVLGLLVVGVMFGWTSPAFLIFIIALSAIFSAFDLPARQSLLPHVVHKEQFLNAVSLTTVARQAAIVVGPGLTGILLDIGGVKSAYIVAVVIACISVIVLFPMHAARQFIEEEISVNMQSIMEGIRFVAKSPLIWSTMILDFIATFFSSATVLLPIFAGEILGTGVVSLGLLYAAPSVGSIIAGVLFSWVGKVKKQGRVLVASVILYGIATIGFGLSTIFWLSCLFLFFTGVGDMISTIIRNTIRQMITPDHLRGRMVSINMIFFVGGPLLGEAEAGFAAALLGVPFSVAAGGIGTIIGVLLLVAKVPRLWHYESSETQRT